MEVITFPDSVVVVVEVKVSPFTLVIVVTGSPPPPPIIEVSELPATLIFEEVVTIDKRLFRTNCEVDVSIVMVRERVLEVLPALSVAVAFILYIPSSSSELSVMEKLPLLSAVPVPITSSPILRVIVEFASALPDIVGVESFSSEILVKEVGAAGAVVSMVMDIGEDLEETLPAASVAVASIE